MKKMERYRRLQLILLLLTAALAAVVGYILWREYQYGVSEAYYDSLRNTSRAMGVWNG